jgi:hypothetical protein
MVQRRPGATESPPEIAEPWVPVASTFWLDTFPEQVEGCRKLRRRFQGKLAKVDRPAAS